MKAVYATVLGKLYEQRSGNDEAKATSKRWFAVAMEQPALLAQHRCVEYEPAVVEGVDSKIFNDDLLHVVGMEAKAYKALQKYYESKGNRSAACISACLGLRYGQEIDTYEKRKSKYLQAIDSLIRKYGDLSEAGELAIERSLFLLGAPDVTAEDNVNYINYALNKWGDWPRMNILRNRLNDLRAPRFNINLGDCMLLPHTDRMVRINFIRNIGTLTLNIYRLNVEGDCSLNPEEPDDWALLKGKVVPGAVQTLVKRYVGQPAWKENSDSLIIKGLPVGVYLVEATTDNGKIQTQRALLNVSGLYLMAQALPEKLMRFVVADATSGEAVAGAHLRITLPAIYDNEKEQTVGLTTDKNGEAYYKYGKRTPNKAFVYTDNDKAFREKSIYVNYSYWTNNNDGQG
ncbi:MAG TPA: alpha-2-macroglobulin, partial [Prevotella sp.]|nr:alpha-2-macroglobulin [Prevotella sp.]